MRNQYILLNTFRPNSFMRFFRQQNILFCAECGYVHPINTGLEEGDLCPNCGNGILVEV